MEMLVVICDRTYTEKIIKYLNKSDVKYHVSFYGKGTASSEILSYFGLHKSEKEVIISMVSKDRTKEVFDSLSEKSYFINHGAVAFTVPMDAIGKNTLDFITETGVK